MHEEKEQEHHVAWLRDSVEAVLVTVLVVEAVLAEVKVVACLALETRT